MHRVTQSPNGQSRRGPITKVPTELMAEIFKFAVLSSEEARSEGVKALCLVGKEWNDIANATSDLWTKVTLAFPLNHDQLSAVRKWLEASKTKIIDVEIDLCGPTFYDSQSGVPYPLVDPLLTRKAVAVLRGSEHRWRSLSISSDVENPIHEFLGAQAISSLPALESINLKRPSEEFANFVTRVVAPRPRGLPVPFGGNKTLMPKLREVSVCAVYLDWKSTTLTQFRNLRKLEINQPFRYSPTLLQFQALAAASPGLETLDVSGYWPISNSTQNQPKLPLIRLPALKNFTFAWVNAAFAWYFLIVLQIPETLETLSLVDTEVGLGTQKMGGQGPKPTPHDLFTFRIFEQLAILGSGNPWDNDPSKPWMSTLGLKSLSLSWVNFTRDKLVQFLQNAPVIEEIRLTDVGTEVFEGISWLLETRSLPSLKRVYLRWIRMDGYQSEEFHTLICDLRDAGVQTIVKISTEDISDSTPILMNAQFAEWDAEWA